MTADKKGNMPAKGGTEKENDTKPAKATSPRRLLGGVTLTKLNFLLWGVAVLAVAALCLKLCHKAEHTTIGVEVSDRIDPTPTIITAMKEIGEWEFLSVADEEMVDTVRPGFLRSEKLVRIYYGRMSLGINMHKADPKWIVSQGDSVVVTLPPIELLDNDFIDEARTRAFIATGSWTDADREALYRKAYALMKARCLTPANISTARQNAEEQLGRMLRAMGIDKYEIRWRQTQI